MDYDAKRVQEAADAVLWGFDWDTTPQGDEYWAEVYDNLVVMKEPEPEISEDFFNILGWDLT